MNSRESGLGAEDSTERMKRAPSPEPRAPSRLPRQVQLVGWVSLVNDFASERICPLLPAVLTGVLGGWPAELQGRAFGLQRGMDHAGAVLGPILAWWLLAPGGGSANVRAVIGWSIVPGVAVLVLASWAVRDGAATGGSGRQQAANASEPMPPSAALSRPLPPPLLAISFFYLLRMPDTLIILRSQELGVPVAIVPLLWAAVHVVRSSSSFLGGAASDRLGPGQTMWVGWLVYAMLAVGMARAGTAAAAWGLFLALGLVSGLTESPERALVARLAGTHQGSGFGLYHGITGFAALVGGVALGGVFQRYGAAPAFLASAAGGLAPVFAWPVFARGGRESTPLNSSHDQIS